MPDPTPAADLIGSTEAMAILEIDRSTLSRWVAAGRLTPRSRIGGNGAFVFDEADVRALTEVPRSPQYRAAHEQAAS